MASFRLAEISGFEVRIDASWFVIFFLILYTLTAGIFPDRVPGLPTATYLVMGVAGALLFFASLLTHELSHSVVARAKGIPVDGITLFIFGGVARTRLEAETPGDEFQIAGVGPLTSVLLAGLFEGIRRLALGAGWSAAFTGVTFYLVYINLMLAAFNLLPGFPLDGGRLLRSALWKATGSVRRATRWATLAGQGLGFLIMAYGAWLVFDGAPLGGVWMGLVGWFLRRAAVGQYEQFRVLHSLEGIPAREAMTPDPVTVPPQATLRDFVVRWLVHAPYGAYPVVDGGRLVGIVTAAQVREVPESDWDARTVAEVMAPAGPDLVARPGDPLSRVAEKMQGSPTRRVAVVEDGRLVGLVTPRDVMSWLERAREPEPS